MSICPLKSLSPRTVVVIGGPTASGKSAFSFNCAKEWGGWIMNGDSMQLYKGLEILTACPHLQDTKQVPHFLYGISDGEPVNAFSWSQEVYKQLRKAHQNFVRGWVVGGTGLYLRSLMTGIVNIPPFDPDFEASFEKQWSFYESCELHLALTAVDPLLALKISDKRRLLYGLKVYYATGKPLSWWYNHSLKSPPFSFYRVLVWPCKEALQKQAMDRFDRMVLEGVLEEVEGFLTTLKKPSPLEKAIGFYAIKDFIQGHLSFEQCRETYTRSIFQYIKRQRTWFRHQFFPHLVIPHLCFKTSPLGSLLL